MIYTVTFNPSLDYIVSVDEFVPGRVNRTAKEQVYPGGKGINVSLMLKNLGMESTALGFTAGFTGTEIEQALERRGCHADFIRIPQGMSRINIKLRGKEETEINGQGPEISAEALEQLYQKLDAMTSEDILVLAGSIPGSMPDTSYELILQRVEQKKMKVIVDATGNLLVNVLKYHPFLVKPNHHELEEIFGVSMDRVDNIITYAKKLQEMGAVNVLVSMAKEGAVLVTENGNVMQSLPPDGKVVNSVGAGDSMVAGFLTGFLTTGKYEEALRMGLAAGSASAFSEWLATGDEVKKLLD